MKSKIFIGIMASIAILLSAISICMNISEVVISDVSLVLGFVGVLATFIVVSNAVQVWKIESDYQKLRNDYDNTIKMMKQQQSVQYNILKKVILTPVWMEYKWEQNTRENILFNHVDNAFLFLIDVIPILTNLYGTDGKEKDSSGYQLEDMIAVFEKILNLENDCNKVKKQHLEKALKCLEEDVPDSYKKFKSITRLTSHIKIKLQEYEK